MKAQMSKILFPDLLGEYIEITFKNEVIIRGYVCRYHEPTTYNTREMVELVDCKLPINDEYIGRGIFDFNDIKYFYTLENNND